jgi:hypothetical protein
MNATFLMKKMGIIWYFNRCKCLIFNLF